MESGVYVVLGTIYVIDLILKTLASRSELDEGQDPPMAPLELCNIQEAKTKAEALSGFLIWIIPFSAILVFTSYVIVDLFKALSHWWRNTPNY